MKWTTIFLLLFLYSSPLLAQNSDNPLEIPGQAREQVSVLEPGSVRLAANEIDRLILAQPGKDLNFPSLDALAGNLTAPLKFRRMQIFASGARVRLFSVDGVQELARDSRQFYLATNEHMGVGLVVDAVSGETHGFINRFGQKMKISGNFIGQLETNEIAESEEGSNSCGTDQGDQPLGALGEMDVPAAMSASAAAAGDLISFQAVVAIETDNEWMDGFGDDAGDAQNWITELFLAMNVFYERDIETRLLIGDVTFRTGSDPYDVASNTYAQLNEFGEYWMDNMGHVERQFAAMFSGKISCNGCFSGIAWVNQYCDYGRWANGGSAVAGSYSFNAIGSGRTPGNTALFVGHELGHNMGSSHTHCYNPPVDNCYNGEGGCFSGNPVCPAAGKGTVMSYCHVRGDSGADCGVSNQEFHPTVQNLLESRLSSQLSAGCIAPYSDGEPDPEPEFESSPPAGATLNFGDHEIQTRSAPQTVLVENLGSAELELSCELLGNGSASFVLENCAGPIAPAGNLSVEVSCLPVASGPMSASLRFHSNDSDEAEVDLSLSCTGVEPPPDPGLIFSGGFED